MLLINVTQKADWDSFQQMQAVLEYSQVIPDHYRCSVRSYCTHLSLEDNYSPWKDFALVCSCNPSVNLDVRSQISCTSAIIIKS